MNSALLAFIKQQTPKLTSTLALAYFLGLIGHVYYFFDLFSHFKIQYFVGGLILFPALVFLKMKKRASLVLLISLLSFVETRLVLNNPLQFNAPRKDEVYTVMSFNHNFGQNYFQKIENWFQENSDQFDVIVLIEASQLTVDMSERLGEHFPYQIHEPEKNGAFGMVVLSKYEFLETEKIILEGPSFNNIAIRIKVKDPQARAPLALYALHPPPPSGPNFSAQRNQELLKIARKINNDNAEHILVVGDLNITPYSQTFRSFVNYSGLKFQSYGLFLNATWPTFLFVPLFKIPIDHALYSDTLTQERKEVGPAFMSDHNSLIIGYSERQS